MTADDIRHLIDRLEGEVNNGGFHQYFFNASGGEAQAAIDALETVGAAKTARIVRRACARFPGGMPPIAREERQAVLDVVDPDVGVFEPEDGAFLLYEEDLTSLVTAYFTAPSPRLKAGGLLSRLKAVARDIRGR